MVRVGVKGRGEGEGEGEGEESERIGEREREPTYTHVVHKNNHQTDYNNVYYHKAHILIGERKK